MTDVALVIGRYYPELADGMATAVRDRIEDRGAAVSTTIDVNGVYDMPLAIDRPARHQGVDAVVVLAAVVTGDTDHDQMVTDAAAHQLSAISVERATPVGFGVIGLGMSGAEAAERTDYGATAVDAAFNLIVQFSSLQTH